jgi:hypothetical protein
MSTTKKKKQAKIKVVNLNPDIKNNYAISLPEGFKTAEKITKVDELEHEIGRLRSYFVSWIKPIIVDGQTRFIEVDPLNMTVKLLPNLAYKST